VPPRRATSLMKPRANFGLRSACCEQVGLVLTLQTFIPEVLYSNLSTLQAILIVKLNLGCFHPVACVRSGDGGFYIRLLNVTIVG
jgi:hypothetical protein